MLTQIEWKQIQAGLEAMHSSTVDQGDKLLSTKAVLAFLDTYVETAQHIHFLPDGEKVAPSPPIHIHIPPIAFKEKSNQGAYKQPKVCQSNEVCTCSYNCGGHDDGECGCEPPLNWWCGQ